MRTERRATLLSALCVLALGCYSYGITYRVLPAAKINARPISEEEVDRAIALIGGIADRWGMTLETPAGQGVEFADGSRDLIGYQRFEGALRHRPAAMVYFGALLGPRAAYLHFAIHDVKSGRKGELVDALDRELGQALRAAFPDRKIERWEGEHGPEFFAG
jgi:hypothetical protein